MSKTGGGPGIAGAYFTTVGRGARKKISTQGRDGRSAGVKGRDDRGRDRTRHDLARDAWLAGEGFRVLRFPNQQIENRGHEVVATILAAVDARLTKDYPSPSA